jgi:MFS family permease
MSIEPPPVAPAGAPAVGTPVAEPVGLWAPERRQLTIALVLTITLVAFEALAIATVMPQVKDDLGGLSLYGWVFSGFFLSTLLGVVVAGQYVDTHGVALPYGVGLALFAVGLAVGGGATSMPMLVGARVLQGLGAGTIPGTVYSAIGRGYPPGQRPKMFATISTAWVVPGLVGPAIALAIEHASSWRFVFLGLVPLVAVAAVMGLPAMAAVDRTAAGDGERDGARSAADQRGVRLAVVLVVGIGAVFAAGSSGSAILAGVLVVAGLPAAVWAFVGLVPKGTLRLVPGVPATVGIRGILTWAFFGADTYIPLMVVDGRHSAAWIGGAALSAGCITWSAASWVQARTIDEHGPRRLAHIGFMLIASGIVTLIAVAQGLPTGFAIAAWAIGCFGMGLAYSPLSVLVLADAAPGEEGAATAALSLCDALGLAIGTGIGGFIVSYADHADHAVSTSTTVLFSAALLVTVVGFLGAARLPKRIPEPAVA